MLLVIDSNRYDHLYLLSYARNDTLTVSFPIYFSLISFICLILAKSSSTILNKYGQSRQLVLCLFLWNYVEFPFNFMLAVGSRDGPLTSSKYSSIIAVSCMFWDPFRQPSQKVSHI